MGAILGGTMRSPLTGVLFALELTHDINMMLPLLVAVCVAHGLTVLLMRRSILTEKIARRGYHLSREYAIDPLEILFAREVMHVNVAALPSNASVEQLIGSLRVDPDRGPQRLYPIVGADQRLEGVVTRGAMHQLAARVARGEPATLAGVSNTRPAVAYPDEPLRLVAHRMAETGLTRFPVVERGDVPRLVGMITLEHLLTARVRYLEAERRRERVMRVKVAFPFAGRPKQRA
jgi:CBS domain-containing protein